MGRKKILLVDDEEIIRNSLAREIGLKNYSVTTAIDGEEAITRLRSNRYDLVITDLVMPGVDGIGVLQATNTIAPETCVILLTGRGNMDTVIEALRFGADDFLRKPCEVEELLFRVARCLEKQSLLRQLSKQNQELKEASKQRQEVEKKLRRSEERSRLALDASSDGLWELNLLTNKEYYGENWHRTLGFADEDVPELYCSWKGLIHPEDRERTQAILQDHLKGKIPRYEAQFRLKNKKGDYQWILSRGRVVAWDERGKPLRIVGTHTDISRLKAMEKALRQAQADLENKVKERTVELEQTNIALKVLLKQREQDKTVQEQLIAANMSNLVESYLLQLAESRLSDQQQMLVDILTSNLRELTSPFTSKLSSRLIQLTPSEIQVANLVRQGKQSKEIAALLHLSPGTINIHRKNIRKKLGLTHKKANLQSTLSAYI